MATDLLAGGYQAVHDAGIDALDAGEHASDPELLDLAIKLLAWAAVLSRDDELHANYVSDLAQAWTARGRVSGRRADLDKALGLHRQAVAMDAAPPEDQAGVLANYSAALLCRFEAFGGQADLDEAVRTAREAARQAEQAASSWAGPRRDPAWRERVDFAWRVSLDNLVSALTCRIDHQRDRSADIGEAARAARQALALAAPGDPALPGLRVSLATVLAVSYERSGALPDLDEAVAAARQAGEEAPPGHPDHHRALAALAAAHSQRYRHTGRLEDLDLAIALTRQAADGFPAADPDLAGCWSQLGTALQNRFGHTRDLAALDEAVEWHRRAVGAAPPGRLRRADFLNNLGNSLRARFATTGDLADLAAAVRALEQAVDAVGELDPRRARCLANLGGALTLLFERTRQREQIERAMTALTGALEGLGRGEPGYEVSMSFLAAAYRARFDAFGAASDLDEAIGCYREAAAATPGDSYRRADYLANLGAALLRRIDGRGFRMADAAEAAQAGQAVEAAGAAPAATRARGGWIWGQAAAAAAAAAATAGMEESRLEWAREAVAGYAAAVALLDLLAWRGLRESDQHRELERFAGLTSAAAAWAVAAGEPARAVELLERGRGVLMAQALDERAVGDVLAARDLLDAFSGGDAPGPHAPAPPAPGSPPPGPHAPAPPAPGSPPPGPHAPGPLPPARPAPGAAAHAPAPPSGAALASRLAQVRALLDGLPAPGEPPSADAREADRRIALARERDALMAALRRAPGYSRALAEPAFDDLKAAAIGGPVVIVNASQARCDALIVTGAGVDPVELTGLDVREIPGRIASFLDAIDASGPARGAGGDQAAETIADTLAWLWEAIAEPVLRRLPKAGQGAGPAGPPRLWWCPTGPLTFLPLHAAGRHDRPGESVLERVVPSYAPTLRLAARSQSRQPRQAGAPPLVVTIPDAPGQPLLPAAALEAAFFAERFPAAAQLRGRAATVAAAARALRAGPRWAHFSCHGRQDIAEPSAGFLHLYDGPLKIGDIARLRLDAPGLAFLSACETHRGGAVLADEAITLATAFQLAGYRHVIGTLWSVREDVAAQVAEAVFERMAAGGDDIAPGLAAVALREAVLAVRERHPGDPQHWAAYAHLGP